MRPEPNNRLDRWRIQHPAFEVTEPGELCGVFYVRLNGVMLRVISSGVDREYGWEHVSVSHEARCPTWEEMCVIKDLFWGEDETVVQFHPQRKHYVNTHAHCLHLWKKVDHQYELPPKETMA